MKRLTKQYDKNEDWKLQIATNLKRWYQRDIKGSLFKKKQGHEENLLIDGDFTGISWRR